ncbi:MAG: GNAT family N-acetyltransferase, partial [Nodularia sp. (in: cyanobacteria)]|nr:GNAT family N-acetyltransferase [Nodularia sp. (in: cyanobacteria)]
MSEQLLPGYDIRRGSTLERSLLVKFMQQTYQDLFPQQDFAHLARTVEQYLSPDTPLWWVEYLREGDSPQPAIACLWVGNAIDQV